MCKPMVVCIHYQPRLSYTCLSCASPLRAWLFFFNDTATTEIYTLSLHDALPIFDLADLRPIQDLHLIPTMKAPGVDTDRKSTRLNSSHMSISYAVFCLKKKKNDVSEFDLVHQTLAIGDPSGDECSVQSDSNPTLR